MLLALLLLQSAATPPPVAPPSSLPPPALETPKQEPAPGPTWTAGAKPIVLGLACGLKEIEQFGLDCTGEEPCPLLLELSSVDAAGDRVFLAGNLHAEAETIYSLLLRSDDAGATWVEASPRIRGAALDLLQFYDLSNGWAAGHIAGALRKDAFFLRTRDGGKTWEKSAVVEDGGVGVVDSFWFDSPERGSMVFDRMQAGTKGGRWILYETMTGGSSWMLRETSVKPLATKRPKSGSGSWRLRVDPKTKAYLVERGGGTAWKPVSSFAVQSGECKPEPPLPPPAQ